MVKDTSPRPFGSEKRFQLCFHFGVLVPTLIPLCSHFVPILVPLWGSCSPLSFQLVFGFLFPLLTTCFRCTSRAMQPSVFSLQCVSRRSRLLVENYRTSCKTHVETYGQRHLSEAFWFWEKISTLFPLWGSCSHFDPTLFPLSSHVPLWGNQPCVTCNAFPTLLVVVPNFLQNACCPTLVKDTSPGSCSHFLSICFPLCSHFRVLVPTFDNLF